MSFRAAFLVGLAVLVSFGPGCVMQSKYRQVVDERAGLASQTSEQAMQIVELEAENASFETELSTAYEDLEDLRVENQELSSRVNALERSEEALSIKLKDRSLELVESQSELNVTRSEVSRLSTTYAELMAELESEVSSGQIEIEQLREGIRVAVSDDVLFESGSAVLDPVGRDVIIKMSGRLASLDHMIEVQGHTDDVAIRKRSMSSFPSNWDLAAARAASVVRLLEQEGVPGGRLTLSSFASHRPVVPNQTAESRAQNRRVEIRLRPRSATPSGGNGPVPDENASGQ